MLGGVERRGVRASVARRASGATFRCRSSTLPDGLASAASSSRQPSAGSISSMTSPMTASTMRSSSWSLFLTCQYNEVAPAVELLPEPPHRERVRPSAIEQAIPATTISSRVSGPRPSGSVDGVAQGSSPSRPRGVDRSSSLSVHSRLRHPSLVEQCTSVQYTVLDARTLYEYRPSDVDSNSVRERPDAMNCSARVRSRRWCDPRRPDPRTLRGEPGQHDPQRRAADAGARPRARQPASSSGWSTRTSSSSPACCSSPARCRTATVAASRSSSASRSSASAPRWRRSSRRPSSSSCCARSWASARRSRCPPPSRSSATSSRLTSGPRRSPSGRRSAASASSSARSSAAGSSSTSPGGRSS